jgi:TolA-binding protein
MKNALARAIFFMLTRSIPASIYFIKSDVTRGNCLNWNTILFWNIIAPQEKHPMSSPCRYKVLLRLLLLLFPAYFCAGCVYFNLYYNAETSYETSLKAHQKLLKSNPDSSLTLPANIESGYKKAIEKSQKLFELYPKKKKWHDKALFLMGRSQYYLGECDKAIRSFRQMQKEFPASLFVPQSYVYIGRSYLKKGNLEEAEKAFALVMEKYPELNTNQEVSMLMAEIAIQREGKSMALEMLEATYKSAKTNDRKIELIIKIAQLYRELKLYDKAIGFLMEAPRVKELTDQLYRIDYLLVSCYADKGEYGRALEIVTVMLQTKPYVSRIHVMRLKKAEILNRLNRIDEALELYKMVAENAAAGDASGAAWFELACIYQTKKGDLKKAKECFDKALPSLKDPEIKRIAERRSKAIDAIFKFRDEKKSPDTTKGGSVSGAEFRVGELFWLELDQADSAYVHYCATARDTQHRALEPKALYAAAWIARYALKDSVRADSLYKLLIARFSGNVYAQQAQLARGEKQTIFTRQDSACEAFEAAGKLFYGDNNPDSAAAAYVAVHAKFPESDFGARSLFAAAWINDFVLDKNRTAKTLYEALCDSFPQSSYCVKEAAPRLKTVKDSLAALRTLRKTQAGAAKAKPGQKVAAGPKNAPDTLQLRLTDVDTVAASPALAPNLQKVPEPLPGTLPLHYNRGMYRSGPSPSPKLPPAPQTQPATPPQPLPAEQPGPAVAAPAVQPSLPNPGSGSVEKPTAEESVPAKNGQAEQIGE